MLRLGVRSRTTQAVGWTHGWPKQARPIHVAVPGSALRGIALRGFTVRRLTVRRIAICRITVRCFAVRRFTIRFRSSLRCCFVVLSLPVCRQNVRLTVRLLPVTGNTISTGNADMPSARSYHRLPVRPKWPPSIARKDVTLYFPWTSHRHITKIINIKSDYHLFDIKFSMNKIYFSIKLMFEIFVFSISILLRSFYTRCKFYVVFATLLTLWRRHTLSYPPNRMHCNGKMKT